MTRIPLPQHSVVRAVEQIPHCNSARLLQNSCHNHGSSCFRNCNHILDNRENSVSSSLVLLADSVRRDWAMDDDTIGSYTQGGDMSWCYYKKSLSLFLFSLFLPLSKTVTAAMKWSGPRYWYHWKLIQGQGGEIQCMSTRFHLADMAKRWMGKVAKNIGRVGRMASFNSFGS